MIELFKIHPFKKHISGNKTDFVVKTFDELEESLKQYQNSQKIFRNKFIVFLRIRYEWEREWDYTSSILEYDINDDCWIWEWDWDEGQDHVEYLGFIDLEEITDNIIKKLAQFMEE